jgi:hypothetical protein
MRSCNLEPLRNEGGKNIRENNSGILNVLVPSILMCPMQMEMILCSNYNSALIFYNNFFTVKFNAIEYVKNIDSIGNMS